MEPGVQRKSRAAQKDFVPHSRLVMCWVPDQVPLSPHPSGNRKPKNGGVSPAVFLRALDLLSAGARCVSYSIPFWDQKRRRMAWSAWLESESAVTESCWRVCRVVSVAPSSLMSASVSRSEPSLAFFTENLV